MKKLDIVKEKVTPHFTTAEKNKKELHKRVDRIMLGKKVPKYIKIHEMAPAGELISFAQYFEAIDLSKYGYKNPQYIKQGPPEKHYHSYEHPKGHQVSIAKDTLGPGPLGNWAHWGPDKKMTHGKGEKELHTHLKSIHEMAQFDGDPRMWKDPLRRNDPDSPAGTVTGTQYSEDHLRTSDTGGNGDAGVTGSLTPPFDSDTNMPANIARSPGGYSKDINTPGIPMTMGDDYKTYKREQTGAQIPMTMGESPIKQFIHGKFKEPMSLKAKYARPKPKLKEERPILDLMKKELVVPRKGK